MTLFELTFRSGVEGTRALFYRGNAVYCDDDRTLHLGAGDTVSFDTYFNLFPHAKYAEYCDLGETGLSVRGSGSYDVTFYHKSVDNRETALFRTACENDAFLPIDFSAVPRSGYLYFTVTARSDVVLSGGAYTCAREGRDVKIGVVICTFRREAFVRNNLRKAETALAEHPELKKGFHFFIVDNAKTLDLPPSDDYTVIPNRNLGGAGGFTRGIVEVCGNAAYTHFLLMDDDISFEFSTLVRTRNLLSVLKDEYLESSVGGAMLILEKPTVQHEFGACFDGVRVHSRNSGLDMAEPDNLSENEMGKETNYNAWWYCCNPVSAAQKHGLPFPFFVRCDDIEYGVRSMENLILMSGIAVWHQGFSSKSGPVLEYYGRRNEAVTSALHFDTGTFRSACVALYAVARQLTGKKYDYAEMTLRAYRDFLRGPDFFSETDPETLNAQLPNVRPTMMSGREIEQVCGVDPARSVKKYRGGPFRLFLAALENYLPAFLLRKKPGVFALDDPRRKIPLFRRTVVYYDSTNDEGYICAYDGKRRKKLRKEMRRLFFAMLRQRGKVRKAYRKEYRTICSEASWDGRFAPREIGSEKEN